MINVSKTHDPEPDAFTAIELRDHAIPGWSELKPWHDSIFIKALGLLCLYSTVAGLLIFLNRAGILQRNISDTYGAALHLFLFMGGFAIFGLLNRQRATLIFISIIGFQTWEFFFYDNPNLYIFYIFFGTWLLFYFTKTSPEIMNIFGMRHEHLASDVVKAILVASIAFFYIIAFFYTWGFKIKFVFWTVVPHFGVMLSQALIFFNLMFAVWNRLKSRGASSPVLLSVLLAMIIAFQAPFFLFFLFLGTISPVEILGGFIVNMLLFVLVMSFTFSKMRSPLASAFLMSLINEMLLMGGII